jgi:hypothetical protein
MEIDIKKFELLDWLKNLEDREVLQQVKAIKDSEGRKKDFDFDEEWENGLNGEEFKAEMRKRIKSYPRKK